MKLKELKKGMKVRDRWWPAAVGTVQQVLKTRVLVNFPYTRGCANSYFPHLVRYDKAHCQFLVKAERLRWLDRWRTVG